MNKKLINGKRGELKYIYNIGYHSYEESDDVQVYHKCRFNKKEFEEIVTKATIEVLKDKKIKYNDKASFQDIFHSIIEELIKNFGFKKVEFTSEFNVFGWADILDSEDWKHDRDEQLDLLTKSVKLNFVKNNKDNCSKK